MIKNADAERLGDILDLEGEANILSAWPQVSRWMIVNERDPCRVDLDRQSQEWANADGNLRPAS